MDKQKDNNNEYKDNYIVARKSARRVRTSRRTITLIMRRSRPRTMKFDVCGVIGLAMEQRQLSEL